MNQRPKLLDLFCGAGGCSVGYHRAGFDVVGVDNRSMPRYPFQFIQADALEYVADHGHEFDAIHASPPCQRYSIMTPTDRKVRHPDLIAATRAALQLSGKPYVIENVRGALHLLEEPIMLCGSMFGLTVWRHRYFEINPLPLILVPACNHSFPPVLITGTTRRKTGRFDHNLAQCQKASGIDWMIRKELDEAIPPAYTEYIGKRLIDILNSASPTAQNR